MQIEHRCRAQKLHQLQTLVKQFNLRWIYNPYPVHSHQPEGDWQVGIDYNNVSPAQAKAFDFAWQRLTTPIRESTKSYSLVHHLKVACKTICLFKIRL